MTGLKVKTGDKGQRYECSFMQDIGERMIIGWTDSEQGIENMRKTIELHPVWDGFKCFDRQEQKQVIIDGNGNIVCG